ncbi:hypothetical protein BVY01_03105, partial [bacterium I07]
LERAIGKENSDKLKEFVSSLYDEFNIIPKLGRGKRISLNLKSSNDTYNFASIQENGEVWFYGIVNKTEVIGDKSIGIKYLKSLAIIVGGKFNNKFKEWNWSVTRNGKYINITEYLTKKEEWKKLISDTIEKINILEDAE